MLLKEYALIAAAYATLLGSAAATTIQWGTCADDFGATLPVDCGRLNVPLDYTDPDGAPLSLELLRSPAIKKPAKGSILLNFGGPGATGRDNLAAVAPLLHMFTGGYHNLIGFDPRGTGSTIPFTCLETDEEKLLTLMDFITVPRADEPVGLGRFWARSTILADQCGRRQNRTGELIGTAFTARDMASVADALDEDGQLRYWGFSYGTTLGATLVSMFPDKIDKVVLDGVQNPHEYYHSFTDTEEWSDTDEEFSHIFKHCAATPAKCALAREGVSAEELEQSVWDLLDHLKYHPQPIGNYIVDRAIVSSLIAEFLYNYNSWPRLAKILDMLIHEEKRDIPFLIEAIFATDDPNSKTYETGMAMVQSVVGIHCGDRAARAGSLEALMPAMWEMANVTRLFDGMPDGINIPCAQWRFEPKERYEGDFQVAPRNPVLIIGNTWDGLTPLRSARNVSSGFNGSVVLEVNGYGHASLKIPSACNLKALRAYWQNGTVPEQGTVCKADALPFTDTTWDDVLRDIGETGVAEAEGEEEESENLELRKRSVVPGLEKALEHFASIGIKSRLRF